MCCRYNHDQNFKVFHTERLPLAYFCVTSLAGVWYNVHNVNFPLRGLPHKTTQRLVLSRLIVGADFFRLTRSLQLSLVFCLNCIQSEYCMTWIHWLVCGAMYITLISIFVDSLTRPTQRLAPRLIVGADNSQLKRSLHVSLVFCLNCIQSEYCTICEIWSHWRVCGTIYITLTSLFVDSLTRPLRDWWCQGLSWEPISPGWQDLCD